MKANPQSGFTLWELLMTLLVAGILFGVGVPSLMAFQRNGLVISAANQVITAMLAARAEAFKRQVPVTLCASADPNAATPVCSVTGAGANGGFFVWVDENANFDANGTPIANDATDGNAVVNNNEISVTQPAIIRTPAPGGTINVWSDSGYVSFGQNGFRRRTATGAARDSASWILICDDRGNGRAGDLVGGDVLSTARAIRIDPTGRGAVVQTQDDVNTALLAIQGVGVAAVCPLS